MRTKFADTAQHADAFFVIRAISNMQRWEAQVITVAPEEHAQLL